MATSFTDDELLERWEEATNFEERDKLITIMRDRHLFPEEFQKSWEDTSGAYPTMDDPNFLAKLLERREFAESFQARVEALQEGSTQDLCQKTEEFLLSPVQRFISNFMSPRTQYMSALLYHGVGVGKTCSAVQIAEQWLHFYPNRKVTILCPKTIKKGFLDNIFDKGKVKLRKRDNEPNISEQCTGTIYMELTNTLYERNLEVIKRKVDKKIRQRYNIVGYAQFANKLRDILDRIPERYQGEDRKIREKQDLQEAFDGTLLIVDEAHNLRDVSPEEVEMIQVSSEENSSSDLGETQSSDERAGKQLTPFLNKLLRAVDGMKLILMTATPMFNSYKEIIFLLNLILQNEKKGELIESDIFLPDGNFKEGGVELLGSIARRYVSFMRGQNPELFPLRLDPTEDTLKYYPTQNPKGITLNPTDRSYINHLAIVPVEMQGDLLEAQKYMLSQLPPGGDNISVVRQNSIIEKGALIVPPVSDEENEENQNQYSIMDRVDIDSLNIHFYRQTVGGELMWKGRGIGRAEWLGLDNLPTYSPKIAKIVQKVQNAEGVCFIYSRFVGMGCIPIALALEANGYTAYGVNTGGTQPGSRRMPLLGDGIQAPGGRQCALCPNKEANHTTADHEFKPACYIILTGNLKISANNPETIKAARSDANINGENIKIIIGSSVASEGVDLRFIREIHVLEPWYHLNKLEQIIGRGIRNRSHCDLPLEKRNCTIYLYANVMPGDQRETGDLYTYRKAYKKARQIGAVTRILKTYAVDCNLNHDAIIINNREPRTVINSQHQTLENVDVNDKPYTAICDWLDTCDYQCMPSITPSLTDASEISYDEFTARWHEAEMKKVIRNLFAQPGMVSIHQDSISTLLGKYPRVARLALLQSIYNNPQFVVRNNGRDGYIIYRNGYFLFQPFLLKDPRIPRAVRMAPYPIRQDSYSPELMAMLRKDAPIATPKEEPTDTIKTQATSKTTTEIKKVSSSEVLMKIINTCRTWAAILSTQDAEIPEDLLVWISGHENMDKKDFERRQSHLQMIRWIAESMRDAEVDTQIFERLILEFIYDEHMSHEEQITFYSNPDLMAAGAKITPIQFQRYSSKQQPAFLYVSREDGKLKYICDSDGKSCSPAIIELINEINYMHDFNVDNTTTGFMYGFLVPKLNSIMAFKTHNPPTKGSKDAINKKLPGKECSIVSRTSDHIARAAELGERLKLARHSDMGMTVDVLERSTRKPKNAQQICTITDLVLRYMDIIKFEGKKWFFRPVEAAISGHKGSFKN